MEFHISRQARDRYQFDQSLFTFSGNVIFANFHAARLFAQKINLRRDLSRFPEQAVRAGQLNAMGLIDEILHLVVQRYRQQRNPQVIQQALDWLDDRLGREKVDAVLERFANLFPPLVVYRREQTLPEYLAGASTREDGLLVPNRQLVLEELLTVWLANLNPAFSPFLELFDDSELKKEPAYLSLAANLHAFFGTQPPFGPDYQNLVDMLRSPALAVPHSLTGQLEYIRNRWGYLLGSYLYRLLSSLDLVLEEEKATFGVGGAGPSYVYTFAGLEGELERFSQDREWMPRLVMIAKNAYVWLDQLSKKYQREIVHLDQIPDEELDTLARWGFTGLWLIGLWERSRASQAIKRLRGNPEAVASAYSLFSYDIAEDLGGEAALQNLRQRAWQRGIRLASDMVPNHMGIDSRWVIEHPDWFLSLDYSPFPAYSFNGPNFSWDSRVGIYLEDHYYDNSDAAVVFKRVDFWSGQEKYIYHGNDGTSMPWNDTAQLNYLKPQVREAVIQTILHVARKFPIIRFDAAMTLAKRHYQRLWFPEPGHGGDIPSRAGQGLTRAQFDQAMPQEFWREVVDRVAQEAPDTLLLAEAFWLMEGYFVRTLGMHRVYNSAFMNMLRDEKNQEYRLVIKNTLEFDPEILKRYVNFMNNPDERTAVDQFGKGDKYFGVCTLLATLPGLPMFGHGQVEGFAEKYGMEFKRAYWDEQPDPYLVERHVNQVFPLLRKRYLFAEAQNFLLYDFFTPEGHVNEDVYAYSNRAGEEAALVVYHNRYAETRGWIHLSAAYPLKTGEGRAFARQTLGEGLNLKDAANYFTIFRDHLTSLEYIRNNQELHHQGLFLDLAAYQCHVFLDFRQVEDDQAHQYAQLAAFLNGRSVPSIEQALKEMALQPIHAAFRDLVNAGMFQWLIDQRLEVEEKTHTQALAQVESKLRRLYAEAQRLAGGEGTTSTLAAQGSEQLRAVYHVLRLEPSTFPELTKALDYLQGGPAGNTPLLQGDPAVWGALLSWLFSHRLGEVAESPESAEQSRTWIDEWFLGKVIVACLEELGQSEPAAWRVVNLVRLLCSHAGWFDTRLEGEQIAHQRLHAWLQDEQVQRFIQVHRYQGVLWFNQECFEELLWWLYLAGVLRIVLEAGSDALLSDNARQAIARCFAVIQSVLNAGQRSGFQVEKLLGG